MCTDLRMPKIRAWARDELSAYSDVEIDRVIREWSSTPRTRGELLWLEHVLAKLGDARPVTQCRPLSTCG